MDSQLERTQYASSILVSQKPIDATEIVRVRLSQAKLLNDEFSDFFKKYYQIKSHYLSELANLVKDSQDLNRNIEQGIIEHNVLSREELKYYNVDAIGNLSEIWSKIISEIKDEIAANNSLKQVVESEVINPLNSFTTKNPQWSEMRNMHARLKEVAQNIELSQEKVDKYNENPSKHQEKLTKYEDQLSKASEIWNVRAPYVFEVFENTDISRLNFLRDSLLRFITAYSDALNKISSSNEKTLETILNFDPEIEINRFAKVSSETQYVPKAAREAAESPKVAQKAALPHVALPTPKHRHDLRTASVATASTAGAASLNTVDTEKGKRRTKLRSKVGSIFGKKNKKDKNLKIEDTLPESDNSSLNDSVRIPARRDSRASSFLSDPLRTQTTGSHLNNSSSRLSTFDNKASTPALKEHSPLAQQNPPVPIPKSPVVDIPMSLNQAPLKPVSRGNSSSQIFNVQSSSASFSDSSSHLNESPVDSPLQQETLASLDQHRAPPPPPSRKAGQFGSQNLTNIREDAAYTFDNTHQTPHGSLPEPPVSASTVRRNIQSGLFANLNSADLENHQNKRLSSFNSFASAQQLRPQATGSSLSANAAGLFQHPEMAAPGLNASVVEVINAKFRDGGQVSSQIIGEVAFSYHDDGAEFPTRTNVKIQGAESFGKIIPNAQFVKQIDSNEFEVVPSAILGRTLGGLKYSIKDIKAPVIVLPVWRFEQHQASVMLTIKLAPHVASLLKEGQFIELNDFVVSVAIKGASKSALSKPQGTFNKDKSRVSWKFKEHVKLGQSTDQKLVARFMTDVEAAESENGVVLKFSVNEPTSAEALISRISLHSHSFDEEDPFSQDDWTPVPCFKTLVAGNYSGLAQ
jgi:hypothetical protein